MYELWDVAKGEAIRRHDVVFWEDKLGSDLLKAHALPHGTEIPPIAQQYVDSLPVISPPSAQLPPHLPLKQLPAQQSVTSLPSQRPTPAGAVFEKWSIDQMQQKYNKPKVDTLLKPSLSNALVMHHAPVLTKDLMHHTSVPFSPVASIRTIPTTPVGIAPAEWTAWHNLLFPSEDLLDSCVTDQLLVTSLAALDDVILSDSDELPRPVIKRPRFSRDASPSPLPRNFREASRSKDWVGWHAAMKSELQKLAAIDAWELVDLPPGKSAIGNRWVFTLKNTIKRGGKLLHKA